MTPASDPVTSSPAPEPAKRYFSWVVLFLGVLLPIAAIVLRDWCAEVLFDPTPTLFHLLLVILVPVANTLMLVVPRVRFQNPALEVLAGVSFGVSIAYALIFLPVLPLSIIGIVVGVGILALSPFGALISAILVTRALRRSRAEALERTTEAESGEDDAAEWPYRAPGTLPPPSPTLPWRERLWLRTCAGIAIAWAVMVGGEAQNALTRVAMSEAARGNPAEQASAVATLRRWKNLAPLEEACHPSRGRHASFTSDLWAEAVSPQEARRVYYLVTGVRCPEREATRWSFDPGQGADEVGEDVAGVSLVGSRLDGSIDGAAALGYVEWTMNFRNDGPSLAEARAQIALPAGAVVSRATLWIDGEEREAVFGSRAKTTAAYRRVVARNRDPLLVTTHGPDRVQIQCFPIAANGGEMKVRIGISLPLEVLSPTRAAWRLPSFVAHNFKIPESTGHSVWIESTTQLSASGFSATQKAGGSRLRGEMRGLLMGKVPQRVDVERRGELVSWSQNPAREAGLLVQQRLIRARPAAVERLLLVVDTGKGTETSHRGLARALEYLPQATEVGLVLADPTRPGGALEQPLPLTPERRAALGEALMNAAATGGVNNVPALARALSLAGSHPKSVILWVHAAQLMKLSSTEVILQHAEREASAGPRILHAQVAPGEDVVVASLGREAQLQAVLRLGELEVDLKRLFGRWAGTAPTFELRREELDSNTPGANSGHQTSDHLARLWALGEVARLAPDQTKAAQRLAVDYRLVTPLSGAVVLETQAEYDAAGLGEGAPDSDDIPSVPEPETYLLLMVAAALLLGMSRRRELGWGAA